MALETADLDAEYTKSKLGELTSMQLEELLQFKNCLSVDQVSRFSLNEIEVQECNLSIVKYFCPERDVLMSVLRPRPQYYILLLHIEDHDARFVQEPELDRYLAKLNLMAHKFFLLEEVRRVNREEAEMNESAQSRLFPTKLVSRVSSKFSSGVDFANRVSDSSGLDIKFGRLARLAKEFEIDFKKLVALIMKEEGIIKPITWTSS